MELVLAPLLIHAEALAGNTDKRRLLQTHINLDLSVLGLWNCVCSQLYAALQVHPAFAQPFILSRQLHEVLPCCLRDSDAY